MSPRDQLQVEAVLIPTPDGQMPGTLHTHPQANSQRQPAILLLMEAFGLTSHIQDVAARLANEGYIVLTPDLYYRELPHNKFGYHEVEAAMAMMYRLDFGMGMENDLRSALGYLKSRSDVLPDHIGVTGFCLGGGLSFLMACKFSAKIAAVAPFYGMVLDEWIAAIADITVPIYLFHGGVDPFIPLARIHQIESRFKTLRKAYTLKVYDEADHGFFCHERSSYHRLAAEDAWYELTQFFRHHVQKLV